AARFERRSMPVKVVSTVRPARAICFSMAAMRASTEKTSCSDSVRAMARLLSEIGHLLGPFVRGVDRGFGPGRAARDRHCGGDSAVDAIGRLGLVEGLVAGLVGLDGDVGEVPAKHGVPA